MKLKDNPKYKVVFESKVHGLKLYAPVVITDYHIERSIAAQAVNIYANAGITKELLRQYLQKMIGILNDADLKTVRTDIAVLCNNLLYRTAYPVDDDAAIRLGCIYTFLENEDPDTYSLSTTQYKEQLARGEADLDLPNDPDLYAFFLSLGLQSMPSYEPLLPNLPENYFEKRKQTLNGLSRSGSR